MNRPRLLAVGLLAYLAALVAVSVGIALRNNGNLDSSPAIASTVAASSPATASQPVVSSAGAAPQPEGSPAIPVVGVTPTAAAVSKTQRRQGFSPQQLVLPGEVVAPVVPVAVAADRSLIIPEDPRQVGWWTGGARPGSSAGAVVIAGHVDSRRFGIGVLAQLRSVSVGQILQVRGAGAAQQYRVSQVQQVPQQNLAHDDQLFARSGPPRLVVITCGGDFDTERRRYADNLIVTAVRL